MSQNFEWTKTFGSEIHLFWALQEIHYFLQQTFSSCDSKFLPVAGNFFVSQYLPLPLPSSEYLATTTEPSSGSMLGISDSGFLPYLGLKNSKEVMEEEKQEGMEGWFVKYNEIDM